MRGFVRALWGDVSNHRDGKIAKEITELKDREWFVVYVYGKENHNWLRSIGYNAHLIDLEPVVWDLETQMYRHKLEVFERATQDFDEFVFLDWDCVPIAKIDDSWSQLNKKDSFQANLFQYRTKKCLWREEDTRKVCNGGFAYFRDKTIPGKMIRNYEGFEKWAKDQKEYRVKKGLDLRFREKSLLYDDEPSMSKYVDDSCGGWQGVDYYWNHFEPTVCNVRKKSAFSKEKLDSKKICFIHNL